MTDLLKNSYRLSMAYSCIFIIIGLLLFVDPEGFIVTVSYLIGLLIMIAGINNIINYSKNRDFTVSRALLGFGIILFIIGLFLILNPTFIGKIVPSLIGVCLIMNAIEKLIYLNYLDKDNTERYLVSLISGCIILIAGIFLLFNPLAGTLVVTQFIGVLIIVYSVIDIIEKIKFKNGVKSVKKTIESKIIDEK